MYAHNGIESCTFKIISIATSNLPRATRFRPSSCWPMQGQEMKKDQSEVTQQAPSVCIVILVRLDHIASLIPKPPLFLQFANGSVYNTQKPKSSQKQRKETKTGKAYSWNTTIYSIKPLSRPSYIHLYSLAHVVLPL